MPELITLTVDGIATTVEPGTTGTDLYSSRRDVVVVRVDGELRDLHLPLRRRRAVVEAVTIDEPDGLAVLRHSAAHVLAQAVQQVNPDAKLGIGPPITDGFYYDFDVDTPFTPEDLKAIEKVMGRIVKEGQTFRRWDVTEDEARAELRDEPYKLELIGLKGDPQAADGASVEVGVGGLTIYDNVVAPAARASRSSGRTCAAARTCRAPGCSATLPADPVGRRVLARAREEPAAAAHLRHRVAHQGRAAGLPGAHRRGRAPRPPQARHRAGPVLLPGRDRLRPGRVPPQGRHHPHGDGGLLPAAARRGRLRVRLHPAHHQGQLYEISGHLDWYADGMFPAMHLDEELDDEGNVRKPGQNYYLKPMNCPMHNLIFAARGRSYRELPLRLFEFGSVYRYEKSGVVHGLTRVRGLTQDDAHIYCTREQMKDELTSLLNFVLDLLKDYGLDDFYLELSTKNPEKFVGSDAVWDEATETLRQVAEASGLDLVPDPGGAAFYGPKISVQAKDALGRTWQMSTIQLDFNLPERFELEYTAADGTRQRPVMIHRALFGSIERFMGVLTEHYAGAFPAWLAPVQVLAVPVAEPFEDYLYDVVSQLRAQGIRAEVDRSDDRFGKKIRNASKEKIPFVLIAGGEDAEAGAVSFRFRDGRQDNGVPVAEAIERIVSAVRDRVQV